MTGILVIDKPADWTSMDVCAKLRGILHEKRVGHGGTLDPMATGVLPVFVGRATRAVEFAAGADKEYIAGLKLGVVTNTQDTTGEVVQRRPVTVTQEDVRDVLVGFRGELDQIPPMYSAVKRDGKKLYELARKGLEVAREPRKVVIKELELTRCMQPDEYELRILCSKGTYVRTLCHDIGQALGCGGTMSALRRTMAAGYTLADAVALDAVQAAEEPGELLRPVDSLFAGYPAATVQGRDLARVKNGNPISFPGQEGRYRVYDPEGTFLLIGECYRGTLRTVKSFFTPESS